MKVGIRTRAFTLVELLVVIGIIALLISILLPALNAAKQAANKTKCAANMKTLSQMDLQYSQDYKGWVPRNGDAAITSTWAYLLATANKAKITVMADFANIGWLQCPGFPNEAMPLDFVANGYDPYSANGIFFMNVSKMKRSSETVAFAEGHGALDPTTSQFHDFFKPDQLPRLPNGTLNPLPLTTGGQNGYRVLTDNRHRGQINLSFYDGHVGSKAFKDVSEKDMIPKF